MSDVETVATVTQDAVVAAPAGRPGRLPLSWVAMLALINVLWAGSAIAAKYALATSAHPSVGLGPCTLAFARFAPSALLLYLFLRIRGRRLTVRREDRLSFLVIGVFGLAVTYIIFYTGMLGATATDSTLLIATEPVLTALMACVVLRERLGRVQAFGLASGFAGAYVIVCQGVAPKFGGTVVANALVAFALWFESFASVVGKRMAGRYDGLFVLTVEMLVGSAALLPFAAAEVVRHHPTALSLHAVGGLAYLAFVCSFFCYGVWFWLLPRMDVSRMVGFLFIQPMMGPIYGYLLLREHLTLPSSIGAVLVVSGVWLVAVESERRRHRATTRAS